MKISPILCFLLFLVPSFLFSQSRQVSGTVTNAKGQPVPLATVIQKGTTNTVTANDNGAFTITVTGKNPRLVISSVNYSTKEVVITGADTYSVSLESAGDLSEVVVTALGIRREKKRWVMLLRK